MAQITWNTIDTAPKDGTFLELWVKKWGAGTDTFIRKRLPMCRWLSGVWVDINGTIITEWRVTHWTIVPDGPVNS